jgi:hypothetical protein
MQVKHWHKKLAVKSLAFNSQNCPSKSRAEPFHSEWGVQTLSTQWSANLLSDRLTADSRLRTSVSDPRKYQPTPAFQQFVANKPKQVIHTFPNVDFPKYFDEYVEIGRNHKMDRKRSLI